jgi:hypothetical protein
MARYRYRTVRNYGNLAFVPWTVEVYDEMGFLRRRFGGWSRNACLRRAYRWVDKH